MRIFEIGTNIYDARSSRPFLLGFRSVKHKSTPSAQLGRDGGGFPHPFLKMGKKCPNFAKKVPCLWKEEPSLCASMG